MNCSNCGFISFKIKEKCGNCGTNLKKLFQGNQNKLFRNKSFEVYVDSQKDSAASTAEQIESSDLETPANLNSPTAEKVALLDTVFELDLADASASTENLTEQLRKRKKKDDLEKLRGGLELIDTQSNFRGTSDVVSEENFSEDFILDLDFDEGSIKKKDNLK